MRIESTNVYVGPNLFARFPVIRHIIDLGELEAWPTGRLGDAFIEPLLEVLPGLHEHGCSYREPGGFVRRMHAQNKGVFVWTVNRPEEMRHLFDLGVDGLISDFPAVLRRVVDERHASGMD